MTHPIPVAGGLSGVPLGFGMTLGALSFNLGDVDEYGVEMFVTDINGWDSPTLRDDVQPRARAHGAYRGRSARRCSSPACSSSTSAATCSAARRSNRG